MHIQQNSHPLNFMAPLLVLLLLFIPVRQAACFPVSDTGQYSCYNNTNSITCPTSVQGSDNYDFYGQDGSYIINPQNYRKISSSGDTLPSDATDWVAVYDNATGLIWEVKTPDDDATDEHQDSNKIFSWSSGDGYAAYLGSIHLAGRSSWKIPTVRELSSLLNYENPSIKSDSFFFPRTSAARPYWSSTLYNLHQSAAQVVSFADGTLSASVTTNAEHFRGVISTRDYPPEGTAHFVDNGDGTITDTATGLMWMQNTADIQGDGNPYATFWRQALSWSTAVDFAGYSDWRLPNINELRSLLEYTGYQPFINTRYFPDTDSSPYWSSTTEPSSPDKAWFVNFNNMANGIDPKAESTHHMVRAVRGGQRYISPSRLYLYAPRQGEELFIGEPIEIDWNKDAFPGPVRLSISRDGGKTYTVFKDNFTCPQNTKYYWIVTGPESSNCSIRIEEIADPSNYTTQSLFSIQEPQSVWVKTTHSNIGAYETVLRASNSTGEFRDLLPNPFLEFTSSDPSVADYPRYYDLLEGVQNGWVEITTAFGPYQDTYSQGVFIFNGTGTEASEPNNSTTEATPAAEISGTDNFYTSTLPENDVDFYTFTLTTASLVEIGYQTNSITTDTKIEVTNEAGDLQDSQVSVDGAMCHFSLALPQGNYYIKLSPDTDYFASAWHMIAWKQIAAYTSPPPVTEMDFTTNSEKTGSIGNLGEYRNFSFTLAAPKNVAIRLPPPGNQADYKVEIVDDTGTVVDSVDCLYPVPVTLSRPLAAGNYTIRVSAVEKISATAVFTLSISEDTGQVEQEPNDLEENASEWHTDAAISGRLSSETDTDIFVFDNAIPRYLQLDFNCPVSNKNFAVSLYKDSLENKINGMETTTGEDISLHLGLTKGRYFIRISASGPAETDYPYTLELQSSTQTRLEIESNNTVPFANAIGDGLSGHRRGQIYSMDDVDYYGFSHTLSDFHIEFFPSATNGDYRVSVVDRTGVTVTNDLGTLMSADSTDGTSITRYDTPLNYHNMPSGDYYVRVETVPGGDVDQYNIYDLFLAAGIPVVAKKEIVAIAISAPSSDIPAGSTLNLTATAYYSDGTVVLNPAFQWESSNPDVADVDASGVVTAGILGGSTTVVASILDAVGKVDITVDNSGNRQHPGNLILVAGGGADQSDVLFGSTQYLTDLVYSRFKRRFFSDRDIFYLNPVSYHDIDGDGYDNNVVDNLVPTVSSFGSAITEWAAVQDTDGPLYIYLIDHGGLDSFKINDGVDGILTSSVFKGFLTEFRTITGGNRKVIVVVEACKSGSFTSNIIDGSEDMVIVTSTGAKDTYIQRDGQVSFSQFFTDQLLIGASIEEAFTSTALSLADQGLPYSTMQPQIYQGSGSLAAQTILGGDFGIGSPFPEFTSVMASATNLVANTLVTISARVADLDTVEKVWSVVKSPAYITPELSDDLDAPDVIQDTRDAQLDTNTGEYEVSFSDFKFNGDYSVLSYAMNSNGNIIQVPAETVITVSGGVDPLLPPAGDINNSNTINLNDAIISLQEVSGVKTGAVRVDYAASGADINGDGKVGLAETIYILKRLAETTE